MDERYKFLTVVCWVIYKTIFNSSECQISIYSNFFLSYKKVAHIAFTVANLDWHFRNAPNIRLYKVYSPGNFDHLIGHLNVVSVKFRNLRELTHELFNVCNFSASRPFYVALPKMHANVSKMQYFLWDNLFCNSQ